MTIILQRHSTLVLLGCILVGLIAQSICQLILVLLILIFQPASPGSAYLCCFYQQANQAGVVLQSLLFHSGLDSSSTMLDCRDRGFFGGLLELAGWLLHSFSKLTKAAEKISNSQTVESESNRGWRNLLEATVVHLSPSRSTYIHWEAFMQYYLLILSREHGFTPFHLCACTHVVQSHSGSGEA